MQPTIHTSPLFRFNPGGLFYICHGPSRARIDSIGDGMLPAAITYLSTPRAFMTFGLLRLRICL